MAAIMENTRFDPKYRMAVDNAGTYKPGTLLLKQGNSTVHIVDYRNKLRAFTSGDQFLSMGYKFEDIITVPEEAMNVYGPQGIDPSDGLGNGQWGTPITEKDPLILTAPIVPDGKKDNTLKYVIMGIAIIGLALLAWKYKDKLIKK